MGAHARGAWRSGPADEAYGLYDISMHWRLLVANPLLVKIHYTFDKESQVNCLARWPHILQIRTIPLDESNAIGVMDLRTCLQAVAQCSPELVGDSERDYTVYAYDYSEPDTPLVGQGLLCWALGQSYDGASPQLVTGRVTKNMLAIFGNGVRETLEVKLRLTAVPRPGRATPAPATHAPAPANVSNQFPPRLPQSTSNMSETTEWNSFVQSNPNLGRPGNVSVSSPILAPARPFNSGYDARNDVMGQQNFQSGPMNPSSRPGSRAGSLGPISQGNGALMAPIPAAQPMSGSQAQGQDLNPAAVSRPGQPRSRPSSRASSRAPTGRPRGRPRKKPAQVEGSTSGYEDGTDADDVPPAKKRAKTTKVERSNTATFGSAPESLRVAASISGSLRNFRPVSMGGEAVSGSHLQEIPRAPTPVPDRMPSRPQSQPPVRSQLRRQSTSGSMDQNASFTSSYLDVNRSMSRGHDARSPTDSIAPSPSQYSEGPSPADIGSSPPVPRSVMYSANSSPAPSSPILPPMPVPQVDSGFMSGGLDENRLDEEEAQKPDGAAPSAPTVAKPKPKRSRAKKPQAPKVDKPVEKNEPLVMHAETPGPPELLPQTSIYNPPARQPPPPNARKQSENPPTPAMPEPNLASTTMAASEEPTPVSQAHLDQRMTMSPADNQSQDDYEDLEQVLLRGLNGQGGDFFDDLSTTPHDFSMLDGMNLQHGDIRATIEQPGLYMEPPPLPKELTAEPELPPMVPASDPIFPQAAILGSEPVHPQTDMAGPEGKSNKNYIKKQAIKQRLDEAIAKGQMPPFCTNCGAIQTPTWRKIYKQEFQGIPSFHEFSEKPGHVTAINVLTRDDEGAITSYEMVKKALAGTEDKSSWNEVLLCNPCGLWFSKWKAPRPADKWEKDQQRLNQTRKRREPGEKGARASKPKKARMKGDSQGNPTPEACPANPASEAYLGNLASDIGMMTDPLGLDPNDSPRDELPNPFNGSLPAKNGLAGNSENLQGPGSTHSRASVRSGGSGRTPGSPIALDDDLGATRRLLFPSPRKDGEQKILGEVAVNIVHAPPEFRDHKMGEADKENSGGITHDDLDELFGTPGRPSTPPPKSGGSGPFKTPTRPTPSHRPITRSVTKSIRSVRSIKSPAHVHATLQRTPTSSAMVRRSPRVAGLPSHMMDEGAHHHHPESPFTRSINQLLSEANDFMASDLDLGHLPHLEHGEHLAGPDAGHWDFSNLLSTDGVMPSSPPIMRHHSLGGHVSFAAHLTYEGDADIWKHLDSVGQDGEGANANQHK